jgi:bifunctional DNase/RNase
MTTPAIRVQLPVFIGKSILESTAMQIKRYHSSSSKG